MRQKAFVQIGACHLNVYPLQQNIYFHLRLGGSEDRDLSELLGAVRELIY